MKLAIVTNKPQAKHRIAVVDKKYTLLWAKRWMQMCVENSLEYREFDSFDPDFIDKLLDYNPWRILWRSIGNTLMKYKDENQRQILDRTNLRILPNWQTHWLYDHKIRQSYLFKLHSIPHPETKVLFNEDYALKYIEKTEYPFVVKADGGAGGKSFRFIENRDQALVIINEIFHRRGKWTGREFEHSVLYAQEYIPAPGVWRIWMFKNKVAAGFFVNNAKGTLKASGAGIMSYPAVPRELFDMTMKINQGMAWDWCMYDIIWSKKHKKYLVLEITDTISDRDRKNRKITYYKKGDDWIPKEESFLAPEYIFNLFVLEEMQ